MVRRRPLEAERSKLAVAAGRLSLFALAMAALSVIIVRSGLLEIVPALATFGAALVLAGFAVLLAIPAFIVIWREGLTGLGYALLAVFIGAALLAYPAYLGSRAYRLPAITDITTDPNNPPRFDVTARLRPRGTNDYPGAQTAQMQRTAYPDIEPLQLTAPANAVYEIALALATKRKWRVVDARPPAAPVRREGTIEAIARSPIMGFRDDVVIRVRAQQTGSVVDVRSASRYGFHDFGDNATRVRSLLEDIEEAATTMPVEKKEPEKPAHPAGKRAPSAKR